MQGGEDSAQRTFAGVEIGNAGQFGVADEGDAAGGLRDFARRRRSARSPPRNGSRALSRPIRELRPPPARTPSKSHGNDNIRVSHTPWV